MVNVRGEVSACPRRSKIAFVSAPITSGKPVADRRAAMKSSGSEHLRCLQPQVTASRVPRCDHANQRRRNRHGCRVNAAVGRHSRPRQGYLLQPADAEATRRNLSLPGQSSHGAEDAHRFARLQSAGHRQNRRRSSIAGDELRRPAIFQPSMIKQDGGRDVPEAKR